MRRKPFGSRELGAQISSARVKSGLSQEALGRAIGKVSRQQVYRWEAGGRTPSALALRAIAEALGVSADELLGLRERQ